MILIAFLIKIAFYLKNIMENKHYHFAKYILLSCLLAATLILSVPVNSASIFVQIKLPKGVSIELPKNWKIMSGNQRITLDSASEALIDLSGSEQINSKLPFAANYFNENHITTGLVNVRYYPDMEFSQNDVRSLNATDVRDFDNEIRSTLTKALRAGGMSIASWKGTHKVNINGIEALITEYRRNPVKFKGAFRVRLVRVIAQQRSFTLTVSYRELDEEMLLRLITDRIISSLQMK